MAGNKKPRKKYRPRAVMIDQTAWVVEGARALVDNKPSDLLTAKIKIHDALLRLMRGESTRGTLDILVNAFNVSQALHDTCRIGVECANDLAAAHFALREICRRTGHIGSATELNAIRAMVELHDAQLEACTVLQFDKALSHVNKQMRHGHFTRILD